MHPVYLRVEACRRRRMACGHCAACPTLPLWLPAWRWAQEPSRLLDSFWIPNRVPPSEQFKRKAGEKSSSGYFVTICNLTTIRLCPHGMSMGPSVDPYRCNLSDTPFAMTKDQEHRDGARSHIAIKRHSSAPAQLLRQRRDRPNELAKPGPGPKEARQVRRGVGCADAAAGTCTPSRTAGMRGMSRSQRDGR